MRLVCIIGYCLNVSFKEMYNQQKNNLQTICRFPVLKCILTIVKEDGKGMLLYTVEYAVRWTALTRHHLADLFVPIPTRLLWEAFSHAISPCHWSQKCVACDQCQRAAVTSSVSLSLSFLSQP